MSLYILCHYTYNVKCNFMYATMSKYTWEQSFCRSGLSASPRWSQCLAEPHRGRPAIFSILSSPDYSHKLWHRKKKKTVKKNEWVTLHQRNPQSPMLTRTRVTPKIDFQSPLGASTWSRTSVSLPLYLLACGMSRLLWYNDFWDLCKTRKCLED